MAGFAMDVALCVLYLLVDVLKFMVGHFQLLHLSVALFLPFFGRQPAHACKTNVSVCWWLSKLILIKWSMPVVSSHLLLISGGSLLYKIIQAQFCGLSFTTTV